MSEPAEYIFQEWDAMCARANNSLRGSCPLLEDEVLVEMHKYLGELEERLAAAESLGEPVAWLCVTDDGGLVDAVVTEAGKGIYAQCGRTIQPLYLAPQPAVPEGWREAILRVRESVCAGGSGSFMQSERIIAETYLDAVEEEIELLAAAFPNGEAGDKP